MSFSFDERGAATGAAAEYPQGEDIKGQSAVL